MEQTIKINTPSHGRAKGRTQEDICPTLQSQMGTGGDNIPYVNNIRRLTEIECERLQGYPDLWTEYGIYDGVVKKIPSTQRYKMLGNSITKTWAKIIAQRLLKK
jgi:DNA (cytosine-5)-methyltransferase 1